MSAIDCFVAAGVRGGDIRKVSFAAGPTSVSVTRSDTPLTVLRNVSCAHVAAGRWVLGERKVTRPNSAVHHAEQKVRFAS